MIAIAAFGMMLSTITRNSAAAVVGTLMWALFMQLLGVLPGTESIRPYLLGTQFNAWNGFLRTPTDWVPIVRALWVCAFYAGIPLAVGYVVFLRRDVAGE
jgi:ABC-2 type transport system permease protein